MCNITKAMLGKVILPGNSATLPVNSTGRVVSLLLVERENWAVGGHFYTADLYFHYSIKAVIDMTRTKLCDRQLPEYSKGEEIMNMVTHIAGGGLAVLALAACVLRAAFRGDAWSVATAIVYGFTMVATYAMSSIYHGLKKCTGKKVMQVLDHCAIYFLIAGTYTPIVMCALRPVYPVIGWGLFFWQWGLTALAVTLTAIDLKKYRAFSMICYIGMGWSVILFLPQTMAVLGSVGFGFLLAGGIAYTVGAILFGLGKRLPWMHSVFHIFVVLGSLLQWVTVQFFVL